MKKNIIVVGDSFCSNAEYWPKTLANLQNLNLICYTQGAGQPWWDSRNWLETASENHLQNTEVMVFAHTNADRIPTDNKELGKFNHGELNTTEIQTAVKLYYKYIFHAPFMHWAQQQWFKEISKRYGDKRLVHLHCFPWTLSDASLLTGINVTTNLTALSLNELGVTQMNLFNDQRPNHLNEYNNCELAKQLSELINNQAPGSYALDLTQFQQATHRWFDSW